MHFLAPPCSFLLGLEASQLQGHFTAVRLWPICVRLYRKGCRLYEDRPPLGRYWGTRRVYSRKLCSQTLDSSATRAAAQTRAPGLQRARIECDHAVTEAVGHRETWRWEVWRGTKTYLNGF